MQYDSYCVQSDGYCVQSGSYCVQSAGSGSGTTSNALSFGGDSPKTATEEWTSPTPTTVSFTVS